MALPHIASAIVYGVAAVLLIALTFSLAQWLLARLYGERLEEFEASTAAAKAESKAPTLR
ncbi:MAG: hypothetical protein ACRD2E_09995 [Terriglobales bacterium]